MRKFEKAYTDTVFQIVRIIFLVGSCVGLLFSVAAVADVVLALQWGFTWQTVLGGVAFALASYGGSLFIRKIAQAYGRIRG